MESSNDNNNPAPEQTSHTHSQQQPNYNNPFNLHFHATSNFPPPQPNLHSEQRNLFEPNQIQFPEIIDPRHQGLTEDVEEFKHFRNIIASFLNYKVILRFSVYKQCFKFDSLRDVARMEKNFASIGEQAKKLKYDYHTRIEKLKDAIELNYSFLLLIVEEYFYMFNLKFNVFRFLFSNPFNSKPIFFFLRKKMIPSCLIS